MVFGLIFLCTGLVILICMILLWLLSLAIKNSSIIDIFWGIGFILVAWLAFTLTPQAYLPRKQLMCALITIWGLRLALHIFIRNWGKPEDFRYAKWRKEGGSRWWLISLYKVFLLQGFLMWIISTPIIAAQTAGFPVILTPVDVLGASIWALGLIVESIADLQLILFRADPANKGKLFTDGLWKYSRHPNYFGEATLWWGVYLIAFIAGAWWTIFSPILMTWLLVRVSGVAMLEKTMSIKPGYAEYVQKTSAFFPWFSKS